MKRSKRITYGVLTLVAVAVIALPASAAVEYGGGNVQGYAADQPISVGSIVVLSDKNNNQVRLATKDDAQNMFGVVVDRNQLPVIISNEQLNNQTYVAVSGTYNVLVSTQGGSIKPGDYVTISSVSGVAMKADNEEKTVFGRATAGFDGKSSSLGVTTLKDESGRDGDTVVLGSIPLTVDIRANPNKKTTKTNLPEFLERAGQAIAEKPVSPLRIYLSTAIAAASLIAAIVIIYSGVRNGVISIGRNPMSKKTIFRALIEIILTSTLILIIGLFAVYLLLKL